jgi:hypothetical protein
MASYQCLVPFQHSSLLSPLTTTPSHRLISAASVSMMSLTSSTSVCSTFAASNVRKTPPDDDVDDTAPRRVWDAPPDTPHRDAPAAACSCCAPPIIRPPLTAAAVLLTSATGRSSSRGLDIAEGTVVVVVVVAAAAAAAGSLGESSSLHEIMPGSLAPFPGEGSRMRVMGDESGTRHACERIEVKIRASEQCHGLQKQRERGPTRVSFPSLQNYMSSPNNQPRLYTNHDTKDPIPSTA